MTKLDKGFPAELRAQLPSHSQPRKQSFDIGSDERSSWVGRTSILERDVGATLAPPQREPLFFTGRTKGPWQSR